MPTLATNAAAHVLNSVIDSFQTKVENLTLRDRLLLRLMKKNGRVLYNGGNLHKGGTQFQWPSKKTNPPVTGYGDDDTLHFAPRDKLVWAKLGIRGLNATDRMNEFEEEVYSKGPAALIKRIATIFPDLFEAMRNQISEDMILDGNAAANVERLCGFETFCGVKSGEYLVTDLIAPPDDTYAGLDTDAGAEGSWDANMGSPAQPNHDLATDWPDGKGTSTYDYWSPKLVNYASTDWTGGSDVTFALNSERVLSRTMTWLQLTTNAGSKELLCTLGGTLLYEFKNLMRSKMQTLLPHPSGRDLGFPNTLTFEGLMLEAGFDVPATTGYIWNTGKVRLISCLPQLFKRRGPTWSHENLSRQFSVGFFGNVVFDSPKYFAKLYPYAAA